MSLTNPKNVITEERLAEFYQTILPYLGGMPDVLANKFSKSDLYSTDEQMIGRWIDGKPLYQKTINFGTLPNNTSKTVEHNIANFEKAVSISGVMIASNGVCETMPSGENSNFRLQANGTAIVVITSTSWASFTESYVTIQYTKTTDSSVEIGNDTDYSTTEKIVGTWIDGKPVYQRVINLPTGIPLFSSNTWTNVISVDIPMDRLIFSRVVSADSSTPSDCNFIALSYDIATHYIKALHTRNISLAVTNNSYIILQYTKTTD